MSDTPADRYARQRILPMVGEAGQERLRRARVVVVGCGATGGLIAEHLARAGVGALRLIDRDLVEWSNLQRQILFTEADADAGTPKAIAAAERLRQVNRDVAIEARVVDLHAANIAECLAGADLVMDGTDNFETRFLLNDACVRDGRPWVYCGAITTEAMVMPIVPGVGPCLRCLIPEVPAPGSVATCDTAGVLGPAVGVAASLAAAEGLRILLGEPGENPAPLLQVDLWEREFHRFQVPRRPDCPACGRREFPFLTVAAVTHATSLCGRNAIQITATRSVRLDLAALAERLRSVGQVTMTPFLLRAEVDGYRLTVFPDARAIVEGTTDETTARALYARYVGV